MSQNWAGCAIPEDLLYDLDHDVWVRLEGDIATMGMTDVAQSRSGRLVHLSWKAKGKRVRRGRPLSVIESGKWVGPFVAPLTGVVLASNASAFEADIAIANRDPYDLGWLYQLEIEDRGELSLLSHSDEAFLYYQELIDREGVRCFRCVD